MLKQDLKIKQIVDSLDIQKHNITKKVLNIVGGDAVLLFVKQLTDANMLSENVIKPITNFSAAEESRISTDAMISKVLYTADCKTDEDETKILEYILSGMTVLLLPHEKKYVLINIKQVQHRSVATPEIQYVVRGPKDCFIENLDVNLSLLRNRIKDPNLRIKSFTVGRRTKSQVAMVYIEDIANGDSVNEMEKRISSIDIDGIYESGELQELLQNKQTNFFPQMGIIERSDMASRLLLEGRIVTLVEGSGLAIYAPVAFVEFLYSCDDYYDNKYFTIFMRLVRYFSLMTAFAASSLYVAMTSFHPEVLPSQYTIILAEMSSNVPFPAFMGAIILEFLMEIIRESLFRVSKHIGSAVGIVAAIVIGQASIDAGIFSPILLIIASVSLLTSFVVPDFTLMNSFRVLKFLLLISTGLFGFYGFMLFLCIVLTNLVSISSFGVPYIAPFAPFNIRDFLKTFMFSKAISSYRTNFVKPKDNKLK